MKILWLASLYPSKLFPYDGDFIQRHASAASLFCNVEVIHVVKDTDGKITSDVKEIVTIHEQLRERIIYYKPIKTSISFVDRFLSSVKYNKVSRKAVKKYISENEKPEFVHLHMAMKAGLTALWLKRKYQVPYILTEHWGGYLAEAKPNISDYNFVYRNYWRAIITEAKICTFVSEALQKHMVCTYKIKDSIVIPNVVNTDIFHPVEKEQVNIIRFVHISTLIYQKNPEAILTALSLLKNDYDFQLELYGTVSQALKDLIHELGLQQRVFINGEVSQQQLAKSLQQADALILYSRFETFGCVLIEANACGVPAIVSELQVFHEIVEEGVNGLFVEGENSVALAEKLKQFILQKNTFDKTGIAASAAEKYNYKKIGQQFLNLYNNIKKI